MSFKVKTKKSGDMIRSEDWNEAMEEIFRLEESKLSLKGGGITGSLSIDGVRGENDGPRDEKNRPPLRFKREEDNASISIGDTEALSILENGNLGIGTSDPQAELHIVGNLLGAAKDQKGNAMRICCGQTPRGKTPWVQNGDNGIYVDVDTSSCDFKSNPIYLTNMHGENSNWEVTGGSSAYQISPLGFRIHVRYSDSKPITVALANSWDWHIQWLAIGN